MDIVTRDKIIAEVLQKAQKGLSIKIKENYSKFLFLLLLLMFHRRWC